MRKSALDTMLLATALFFVSVGSAQRFNNQQYSKKFIKVRALLNEGKLAKGQKLIDQLKLEEPNSAHIIATSGRIKLAYNEFSQAEREFKKALKIDGENAIALLGMAEVHEFNRDYEMASVHVEKAFFFNEELYFYEPIVTLKAKMHMRNGNYLKAEEVLAAALKSSFKSASIMCELSIAQYMQGKKVEALKLIHDCPEKFGRGQETYNIMGEACNRMGEYILAIQYLRQANNISPGNVDVYINVAHSYYMIGDDMKADLMIQMAMEQDEEACSVGNHLKIRLLIDDERCKAACKVCRKYATPPLNITGDAPLVTYDLKEECGCN